MAAAFVLHEVHNFDDNYNTFFFKMHLSDTQSATIVNTSENTTFNTI